MASHSGLRAVLCRAIIELIWKSRGKDTDTVPQVPKQQMEAVHLSMGTVFETRGFSGRMMNL